ncbi:hypothetical protein [Sciscionella sediminilitoris]|uniref:hypothetical protein n=1 Tax=Sciscionella sediminilitoris TaxID=1445613 RepID=UPI0004DFB241|nr:hypothetical protein [Sciscionella sp. SE31]
MASDIVPIELGLPQGDLVTLWAPRWREDGEEWEAFLGDEDDLYGFENPAQLAAFVRTVPSHDLADHPAWHVVAGLAASELVPDDDHSYDLVGVPELVAENPDSWTISELDEIVGMVRSIAEVCELEKTEEVLGSTQGFRLLHQGTLPFTGKDGQRVWEELCEVVAERWDEVLDEIDEIVSVPGVDAAAVAKADEELAAYSAEVNDDEDEEDEAGLVGVDSDDIDSEEETATPALGSEDEEEEPGFWAEIGIDPIKIIADGTEYYTLRCYLDDKPIFLGSEGRIDVFGSPRALVRHIAGGEAAESGSALTEVATWSEVATKATAGELEVEVDEENTYVLTGIAEDIAEGPDAIDPNQLDLAVELFGDAAQWAGDDSVDEALAPAESLGWFISFVLRPDPTRLAPSEPYTDEEAAWRELAQNFEERLRTH